jgi:hypothetical protein
MLGVIWTTGGPMWVSPSKQTFVWTRSGWWNKTAHRAATVEEAAAANQAMAACRTMSDAFRRAKYAAGIPRSQQPIRQWTIRGPLP